MELGEHWRALGKVPAIRTALFLLGCLLILLAPVAGVLPGPGGLVLFATGAALVLRYSSWAKRRYAVLKRRFPRWIFWSDWALRRPSLRRREERRKRSEAREAAAAAARREVARVERHDGEAKLVLVRHQFGSIAYFIERRFDPQGPYEYEYYWAAVGFSALYQDVEIARRDGLRDLEQA